jgi:hypothetical protein
LTIFKTEKIGERIVTIINKEITLQANLEAKEARGRAHIAATAGDTTKKAANGNGSSAHSQTRENEDASPKASNFDLMNAQPPAGHRAQTLVDIGAQQPPSLGGVRSTPNQSN